MHDCLQIAFLSVQNIHQQGGMSLTIMEKPIIGMVWIHFCVGDSQRNNQ